jgi:2-polyprenyl-6-methoxyphenol hydroxylase-like FAD-dependent oxidoreductase
MARNDVLIIGAGPSGLVLALWLNKLGVNVRILDKAAGPGTTSRALLVHARTLELYRQLDLAEAVVAGGYKADVVNMWADGKRRARVEIGAIGKGMTPFPWLEIFPQDAHEKLLVERLAAVGMVVERNTELLDFTDMGSHVTGVFATRRVMKRLVKRCSSPDAMGHDPLFARRSSATFPAERTGRSSTWPTSGAAAR